MKNFMILSTIVLLTSGLNAAIEVDVNKTKTTTPIQQNGQINTPSSTNPVNTNGNQVQKPDNSKIPADINVPQKATDVVPNASSNREFTKDHDIAKAIYDAIRKDRIFSTDSKIKIQVTVYNGKITLSGDVPTQAEKDRAELLATQINKLDSVTNNIRVTR